MTLAIVGHNPGIHDLAITLDDGRGDDAARTELAIQYRISGVAVFSVSDPWTELTAGFSLLATGLSRKERITKATCGDCHVTWMI